MCSDIAAAARGGAFLSMTLGFVITEPSFSSDAHAGR